MNRIYLQEEHLQDYRDKSKELPVPCQLLAVVNLLPPCQCIVDTLIIRKRCSFLPVKEMVSHLRKVLVISPIQLCNHKSINRSLSNHEIDKQKKKILFYALEIKIQLHVQISTPLKYFRWTMWMYNVAVSTNTNPKKNLKKETNRYQHSPHQGQQSISITLPSSFKIRKNLSTLGSWKETKQKKKHIQQNERDARWSRPCQASSWKATTQQAMRKTVSRCKSSTLQGT